jgi:hypothetical protein
MYAIYQNTAKHSLLVKKDKTARTREDAKEKYLKVLFPSDTDKRNAMRPHLMAVFLTNEQSKLISKIQLLKNNIVAKQVAHEIFNPKPLLK